MRNLSDGQLGVLSQAAQRNDGAASLIGKLKGGAATKVGKALITRKLMREVKAKPGMPVWRRDAEGRPFSLVISAPDAKPSAPLMRSSKPLPAFEIRLDRPRVKFPSVIGAKESADEKHRLLKIPSRFARQSRLRRLARAPARKRLS